LKDHANGKMTVHKVEGLIRKSGSRIQRHVPHDTEHGTTFIWRLLDLCQCSWLKVIKVIKWQTSH